MTNPVKPQDVMRYALLMEMANDTTIKYERFARELEWLNTQPLEHARPGFEYWHAAFKKVPEVRTIADVHKMVRDYLIVDSEFHCTPLNTVNIGMKCFVNSLMNRWLEIRQATYHPTAEAAVNYALANLEQEWQKLIREAAKEKGINDLKAFTEGVEVRRGARAAKK